MSLTSFFYEPFYSLSDFDRLFDEAFSARQSDGNGRQLQRQNSNTRALASNSLRPKYGLSILASPPFILTNPRRMDVHENKDSNTVTATFELPGLKKEDVNIDVHNNVLTISGESKVDTERNEEGYAVRERRYGRFSRSVPLPQGIKNEEIKAAMENGVLTVTFPKSAPESAPKKIAIA
ncbi:small heat shock protein [Amylostereum chailletii]|nr:small heat shock protein [Amylostereum chailletii]